MRLSPTSRSSPIMLLSCDVAPFQRMLVVERWFDYYIGIIILREDVVGMSGDRKVGEEMRVKGKM